MDKATVLPLVRVALDIIFAIASALGWRVRWLNNHTTDPEEPKVVRDNLGVKSGRQAERN